MQKLTIGRLAEASGVHLETIRYYERIGLIRKPERTAGGHRFYKAADLEQLRFILCARELGFRIEKVREKRENRDRISPSCDPRQSLRQAPGEHQRG